MLVLSRKVGDAIMLGTDIEVKILEVHGTEIKLGIDAPKSVTILRKEICEGIKKQNKNAADVFVPKDLKNILKPTKEKLKE
jgi:carbon storage regulator